MFAILTALPGSAPKEMKDQKCGSAPIGYDVAVQLLSALKRHGFEKGAYRASIHPYAQGAAVSGDWDGVYKMWFLQIFERLKSLTRPHSECAKHFTCIILVRNLYTSVKQTGSCSPRL